MKEAGRPHERRRAKIRSLFTRILDVEVRETRSSENVRLSYTRQHTENQVLSACYEILHKSSCKATYCIHRRHLVEGFCGQDDSVQQQEWQS